MFLINKGDDVGWDWFFSQNKVSNKEEWSLLSLNVCIKWQSSEFSFLKAKSPGTFKMLLINWKHGLTIPVSQLQGSVFHFLLFVATSYNTNSGDIWEQKKIVSARWWHMHNFYMSFDVHCNMNASCYKRLKGSSNQHLLLLY